MAEFETRIQHFDETDEEFMTPLLQLYRAANPEAKSEDVNSAVKRKFLHGINDTLHRNIFIFFTNPFSDYVISPKALLKASCDAVVHLSASVSSSANTPTKSSLSAQAAVFTTASAAALTPHLDKVLALTQQLADQAKITNAKFDQHQQQIELLKQISFQPPYGPNFQTSLGRSKYQQNFCGRTCAPPHAHFGENSTSIGNSQPGVNQQTTIFCHFATSQITSSVIVSYSSNKILLPTSRKLWVVSIEGHNEAKTLRSSKTHCSSQDSPERGTQLLWLKGHLNGKPLDMMLDSGATVCCLAKRCFEASPNLKHECLIPYNGPGLLDTNGNFLRPCGIIKEPLTLGTPNLILQC